MIAVILAGGHGECLRLEEDYVPKVLLPVGEKPLLEHQLAWLRRAGFEEVALCLGYKAEAVRSHFGDGSRFGVRLSYSVEETPRGTAGAVKALGLASLPDEILVLCGDIFPETEVSQMLDFHRSQQAMGTLALHPCGQGRHHVDCQPAIMGPSRAIVDFPPAPAPGAGSAVSPLWIIHRSLLHLAADSGPSDFLKDVFPAVLRRGEKLLGYHERGVLADIGSAEDYARFQERFSKKSQ